MAFSTSLLAGVVLVAAFAGSWEGGPVAPGPRAASAPGPPAAADTVVWGEVRLPAEPDAAAGSEAAGGSEAAAPSEAAVKPEAAGGADRGTPTLSLRYRLHVPPTLSPEVPPGVSREGAADGAVASAPLLLFLHGCTQDPEDAARGTRLDRVAGEAGMLVLYPEQPEARQPLRCWRWYEAAHQRRGAGEPALLMAAVEEVARDRPVDPERVYVAGMSAGGAMALVLAAAYPERFAGVATHSGVPYGAARNGVEAQAVLGGRLPADDVLSARLAEAPGSSARNSSARDAAASGLPPLLVIHGDGDTLVAPGSLEAIAAAWRAAGGEAETRLVEGLGHAWSGGDPEGSYTDPVGPDATSWIVEFFRDRTR